MASHRFAAAMAELLADDKPGRDPPRPFTPHAPAQFVRGRFWCERPTSVAHWQLCDLIKAEDDAAFYCVHDRSVLRHDAVTGVSALQQLPRFKPCCLAVGGGYLATGGLKGELCVSRLEGGPCEFLYDRPVGAAGAVNNALHLAALDPGAAPRAPSLFVANNDATIRVFNAADMAQPPLTLHCGTPMNGVAYSSERLMLAATGDCAALSLYHAAPEGFRLLRTLREARDAGLGVAFSAHHSLVASAHQDGVCCVWDARSCGAVAKFGPTRCALRNVQFSTHVVDLMAMAEDHSRVHLVDARRWDALETVAIAPGGDCEPSPPASPLRFAQGGAISGIGFSPSGRRLFVGVEGYCMALEVDLLQLRVFGAPGSVK